MMRYTKILPALLAAGALVAAGCGDDDSSNDSASSAAGNAVDRAFVADMVPHHRSAVEMATIAQERGESKFVKQLADDIARTQDQEIDVMRGEDKALAAAGIEQGSLGVPEHMTGMDGEPSSLRTATPFDKAFIDMMLPHHEGAVVMAKAELAKGKSSKLKTLAQSIIVTQQREIAAMRKHLGADGEDGEAGGAEHGAGHSG